MAGNGDGDGRGRGNYNNNGNDDEDFYGVLGLDKECTPTELRNAYKKLAMKWHPDRCSASDSGDTRFVEEEAKKKFQAIQQAYSVLSDANQRFLYDVGVYDTTDDDENNHLVVIKYKIYNDKIKAKGMGEFLNEMAAMMRQTQPSENGEDSFEELQVLFHEMFQSTDVVDPFDTDWTTTTVSSSGSTISTSNHDTTNKRSSSHMNFGDGTSTSSFSFDSHFQGFCLGSPGHKRDIKRGKLARGNNRGGMRSSARPRH